MIVVHADVHVTCTCTSRIGASEAITWPRMLGPSAFSCDVLSASAPLVQILHDISFEWSQAYQRKGKPVVRATARAALCSFDGSPCPIFARPIALLAGYRAHNGVLRFHTVGEATSTAVRDLSTRLVAMGAVADAANYDVLLLPVGTSPPRCAPQLVVWAQPSNG